MFSSLHVVINHLNRWMNKWFQMEVISFETVNHNHWCIYSTYYEQLKL